MAALYPALAALSDIEERVERVLTGSEAIRAEALLNSVSIKVRRASGRLWLVLSGDGVTPVVPYEVDPVLPEIVWDITVTAVERAIRNPDGYSSESAGDYSYQRVGIPGGVGGVYLTEDERAALAEFKPGDDQSVSGLWTLSTTKNEFPDDTIWYHMSSGADFPLDSMSDFPN